MRFPVILALVAPAGGKELPATIEALTAITFGVGKTGQSSCCAR